MVLSIVARCPRTPPPPSPKIPINFKVIIRKLKLFVVIDFRSISVNISAGIMSSEYSAQILEVVV